MDPSGEVRTDSISPRLLPGMILGIFKGASDMFVKTNFIGLYISFLRHPGFTGLTSSANPPSFTGPGSSYNALYVGSGGGIGSIW
jgi:hypothetical protein